MGMRIADSRTTSSRSSYIVLIAVLAILVALSGVVG